MTDGCGARVQLFPAVVTANRLTQTLDSDATPEDSLSHGLRTAVHHLEMRWCGDARAIECAFPGPGTTNWPTGRCGRCGVAGELNESWEGACGAVQSLDTR